jgi:hypothetical protein
VVDQAAETWTFAMAMFLRRNRAFQALFWANVLALVRGAWNPGRSFRPTRRIEAIYLSALISVSFGCSRNDLGVAEWTSARFGNVRTALSTGPNCVGSGDPMTGVSGNSICTGVLGQTTFQRAICSCGSVNASARQDAKTICRLCARQHT